MPLIKKRGNVLIPPEVDYLYFILSRLLTHATCHDSFPPEVSPVLISCNIHEMFTPGAELAEEGVQQDRAVACVV
jgi:hypothetical protein